MSIAAWSWKRPRERWKQEALQVSRMFLLQRWFRENEAQYRVRSELEPIDGQPCHVVEWPDRDVVWIDATAGYSVRRRIFHYPSGAVAGEFSAWGYREMKPGMWIPLRFDSVIYNRDDAPEAYRQKVAKTVNMTLLEARFDDRVPDELFEVREEGIE
jgi:hypothetical protein